MTIRPYSPEDEKAIIELWRKCNLLRPWNNPKRDIQRKLMVNPELFLVGLVSGKLVASAMGGYEGHRGWINYVAVDPTFQRMGFGRQIMQSVEDRIRAVGCPKINLLIRRDNPLAIKFYESIGYKMDDVITLAKRLVEDKSQHE